jgi:hypothetical protein
VVATVKKPPTKKEMLEFLRDKAQGLRAAELVHVDSEEEWQAQAVLDQMKKDADMLDAIAEMLRHSATVS